MACIQPDLRDEHYGFKKSRFAQRIQCTPEDRNLIVVTSGCEVDNGDCGTVHSCALAVLQCICALPLDC